MIIKIATVVSELSNCYGCPFSINQDPLNYKWLCSKMKMKPIEDDIGNARKGVLPEWCPLPDKEVEE